jgi:serine/threonine protein kinase
VQYPSKANIIDSVRYPILIKDSALKGGVVVGKAIGGPRCWSGGFSLVFQINKNGDLWAFKVWHTHLEGMKDRYAKIAKHLEINKLPYFTEFGYLENGLWVEGTFIATHRMRWVQGATLDEYIQMNISQPNKLLRIAARFLKMVELFHEKKIAHGDLQHGNIIVNLDDELAVIDYDSMCVSEIEGMPDVIKGLAGYQHPQRINNTIIHEKLDHFSELIIYLSLTVYAERPELWNSGTDWLLFSKEDLLSPNDCPLIQELKESSNPLISYLTSKVEDILLLNDIREIPSLDALLSSQLSTIMPSLESITDKF